MSNPMNEWDLLRLQLKLWLKIGLPITLLAALLWIVFGGCSPTPVYHVDFEESLKASGITQEQINPCMDWAMGEGWELFSIHTIDDRLRARHGDLFGIDGTWEIHEAFKRIGEVCSDEQI